MDFDIDFFLIDMRRLIGASRGGGAMAAVRGVHGLPSSALIRFPAKFGSTYSVLVSRRRPQPAHALQSVRGHGGHGHGHGNSSGKGRTKDKGEEVGEEGDGGDGQDKVGHSSCFLFLPSRRFLWAAGEDLVLRERRTAGTSLSFALQPCSGRLFCLDSLYDELHLWSDVVSPRL